MGNLTIEQCRKADLPTGRSQAKLYDGNGLLLFLRGSSKTWRFKYKHKGKEKLYTIGPFPRVSITNARKEAVRLRAELNQGNDPSLDKKTARAVTQDAGEYTFEILAKRWFRKKEPEWSVIHYRKSLRAFERDVLPELGKLPIGSITPMQISRVLDPIQVRALETAHRLRQHISGVFRLAVALGLRPDDPAALLSEAMYKKDAVRPFPAITDIKELRGVLVSRKLTKVSAEVLLAHRTLAFTCLRIGEVLPAKWSEFDLDAGTWSVPRSRMKVQSSDHDHVVPLPAPFALELSAWKRMMGAGVNDFVFPSSVSKTGHIQREAVEKVYRITLGLRDRHTPHGWRSALNTIAVEHEFEQRVIDLQLDHVVDSKVERSYNRASMFKQRRELMTWWYGLLTNTGGSHGN